jgi:hypothetical protein
MCKSSKNKNSLNRYFMAPFQAAIFKTPLSGAQTTIRLAVDPELENETGKYYSDCVEKAPSRAAQNDETAEWLWKTSEEWTGLSSPNTVS